MKDLILSIDGSFLRIGRNSYPVNDIKEISIVEIKRPLGKALLGQRRYKISVRSSTKNIIEIASYDESFLIDIRTALENAMNTRNANYNVNIKSGDIIQIGDNTTGIRNG